MARHIKGGSIRKKSLLLLLKLVSLPGIFHRSLALFIAVFLVSESVAATPKQLSPLFKGSWGGASSLAQQPAATSQDATRAAAERAYQEGEQLFKQGTAESLQQAITKFEEALPLYRAVGDKQSEAVTLYNIGYIYDALGEKQKALDYFNQSLPLSWATGDKATEALTLTSIGAVYSALGEKQKALDYFNQSLPLSRATGDKATEARTLTNIGSIYDALGEKQKALEYFNQSLPLTRATGDEKGEAATLTSIGLVYSDLGEKQKALEYYNQSLPLTRATGDKTGEAATLHNIGSIYDALGEKQKALDYYNQSLPLTRATGYKAGEAATLTSIGAVYSALGEKQKALDYYNQSLPLSRATGDKAGEAVTLTNIGEVYDNLGEKQKALDYYNQSLPLSRATGDKAGEAATLTSIGLVYDALGEKQKALDYYNQSLPLSRATGDKAQEARTLINIGGVYDDLGEKQKALDYYNQSLPLSRVTGDKAQEAVTLNNIGLVYSALGEKQKALDYYNQSLSLSRATGDKTQEALTLNNIGRVYDALGEKQKALEYFNQSLPLSRATGDKAVEAATLNNIGLVYDALGEQQKALEYYNQSLPLTRATGYKAGEATTLFNVAYLERNQGNLNEAFTQMKAAIEIIETLRTNVASQQLRTSYFASKQDYYQFYIDLLMQLHKTNPSKGYDALALNASERTRARNLLEILTEARADIRRGVDPKLREQERTLQQQINALDSRKSQILSGQHGQKETEELNAIPKQIESLLGQLDEVQAQIRQKNPTYAALTQPGAFTLNLQQIQQQVLDDNTLLLEYSLGEDRSYLWAVTKTGITSYELPKRADIEAAAQEFYDQLKSEQGSVDKGMKLSQMLLAPVAGQLGNKRLLIVSDGKLQMIPFAALPIPENTKVSVLPAPRPEINDTVGELRKGYTPLKINVDVWAKHSGDQFCYSTKIFISECFALPRSTQGEAYPSGTASQNVKINPGLIPKFGYECFAPTESCMKGITPNQFANNILKPLADVNSPPVSPTPLLVQNEIVSLPSASTIAVLRSDFKNRQPAPKTLAVLADPVFSRDDIRFQKPPAQTSVCNPVAVPQNRSPLAKNIPDDLKRSVAQMGTHLDRLPYSRCEAQQILNLVPPTQREQAFDFTASRATATSPELAQYRLVHFATHGLLNYEHPELSGVVMSLVDEKGTDTDGFLRLNDIFNLNLPAELVVLSACETGLVKNEQGELKEIPGEGLVGLTRGFMYAGAKRVVVSLWSVNDRATAELMTKFYQQMLNKGVNPVAALRAAQLEMWNSKQWKNPYKWAAFVIQGEWR